MKQTIEEFLNDGVARGVKRWDVQGGTSYLSRGENPNNIVVFLTGTDADGAHRVARLKLDIDNFGKAILE